MQDPNDALPALPEPNGTDEVAIHAEEDGLVVYGDGAAVARYVARLREQATDAVDTRAITTTRAAHGVAVAMGAVSIKAQAGEFVRLSPQSVEAVKKFRLIPGERGFFRMTVTDSAGKFRQQLQWQKVNLGPTQMLSVQMLAVQLALASAVASVEKAVARVEGKVESVLALAEASRAGDVRGHHAVLERMVGTLEQHQRLPGADWDAVAGLGPDLIVTIERLRHHIQRTMESFDPALPVQVRAERLAKAVEVERFGETLNLLVVSEHSLYLWQRLRIARVGAKEPEHLPMVMEDARGLLRQHVEQDGELVLRVRAHLTEFARMNRLDGFRIGSTRNLERDLATLRSDIDGFAEARGHQVAAWVRHERPSLGDAFAELGQRTAAAGNTAAGVAGRAFRAGISGLNRNRPGQQVPAAVDVHEDLVELVTRKQLTAGQRLTYRDAATGTTLSAQVQKDGALEVEGQRYGDPASPLIALLGPRRHGWRDWQLSDGRRLEHVRRANRD